jgi:hypothetical protein
VTAEHFYRIALFRRTRISRIDAFFQHKFNPEVPFSSFFIYSAAIILSDALHVNFWGRHPIERHSSCIHGKGIINQDRKSNGDTGA